MPVASLEPCFNFSDCFTDPSQYVGTHNTTVSGAICQRWDSQTPQSHTQTADKFPEATLAETNNYCRNPGGQATPWCYTVNGPRWEYCNIPKCGKKGLSPKQRTNEPNE